MVGNGGGPRQLSRQITGNPPADLSLCKTREAGGRRFDVFLKIASGRSGGKDEARKPSNLRLSAGGGLWDQLQADVVESAVIHTLSCAQTPASSSPAITLSLPRTPSWSSLVSPFKKSRARFPTRKKAVAASGWACWRAAGLSYRSLHHAAYGLPASRNVQALHPFSFMDGVSYNWLGKAKPQHFPLACHEHSCCLEPYIVMLQAKEDTYRWVCLVPNLNQRILTFPLYYSMPSRPFVSSSL